MKKYLLKFLRSEDGPTAVEYAIILAMILLAFIVTVDLIGLETKESYNQSSNKIDESFSQAGIHDL